MKYAVIGFVTFLLILLVGGFIVYYPVSISPPPIIPSPTPLKRTTQTAHYTVTIPEEFATITQTDTTVLARTAPFVSLPNHIRDVPTDVPASGGAILIQTQSGSLNPDDIINPNDVDEHWTTSVDGEFAYVTVIRPNEYSYEDIRVQFDRDNVIYTIHIIVDLAAIPDTEPILYALLSSFRFR